MTEQTNKLSKLLAACWKDADLKVRFQASPTVVLAEYGMEVLEGVDVIVVENSDNTLHITLPVVPDNHLELSDDELENATGGVNAWVPGDVPNLSPPDSGQPVQSRLTLINTIMATTYQMNLHALQNVTP